MPFLLLGRATTECIPTEHAIGILWIVTSVEAVASRVTGLCGRSKHLALLLCERVIRDELASEHTEVGYLLKRKRRG